MLKEHRSTGAGPSLKTFLMIRTCLENLVKTGNTPSHLHNYPAIPLWQRFSYSFLVKKKNAIVGLLEVTKVTNWMLSNAYPFAVHSFRIFSSSSSVTVLVSTTLYGMAVL